MKNKEKAFIEELSQSNCHFLPGNGELKVSFEQNRGRNGNNDVFHVDADQMKIVDQFLDLPGVIFLSLNASGRVIYINKGGAKILGYDRSEVMNKNWFDHFVPLKQKEKRLVVFNKMIQGKYHQAAFAELPILTKNNGERIFSWQVKSIGNKNDQVMGTYCSGIDITARQKALLALEESETKFRILTERSKVGVAILCKKVILYLNPKFASIFEWKIKELQQENILTVAEERSRRIMEKNLSKSQAAVDDYVFFEFKGISKQGRELFIEAYVSEISYQGKKCRLLTVIDSTQRKKLEDEVQRIKKMSSVRILVEGIAHDFNNLLTVIRGYVQLAKEGDCDRKGLEKYISRIEKATESATKLIHNLQLFADGLTPLRERNDLSAIVRHCVSLVFAHSLIKTHVWIADKLWLVNCNKTQMERVFINLFLNAKEAMPYGGEVEVTVENFHIKAGNGSFAHEILPPGFYVRVKIKDYGMGITENLLEKIYDPYFSTKEKITDKGLGLGLAIVHSIINNHRGHIEIQSELKLGTTVWVCLPAQKK